MKNKKKIVAGLIAVVMLLGAVIGTTLAWFTDSDDTVTNTFTVGNVEIVLYERSDATTGFVDSKANADTINTAYQNYLNELFDAEGENGAQNFVPGYTVTKNAYVSNIGTVDSWVGATYSIPTALVTNGEYKGIDVVVNTTDWTLLGTKEESGITTYYYGLNEILDSEAEAPVFVKSVSINEGATNETADDFFHKLVEVVNGTEIADKETEKVDSALRVFDIVINAYAIQAPSLDATDVEDALATGFPTIFTFGA